MSHRYYILGILFASVLGWVSWFVVINKLSPFISGYLALSFFYGSLFIALTGTLGILNYYLRLTLNKDHNFFKHMNISLRQSSLLSIMICVGLIFQRLRVLTWWDALLLLIIVVLIEYYFMNRE